MAFKMKGFNPGVGTGLGKKIQAARAKRLIRKNVEHVVHPDFGGTKNITEKAFNRADKKMIKADKLLKKAGYGKGQRESATGSEGVKKALNFAKKKSALKKKIDPPHASTPEPEKKSKKIKKIDQPKLGLTGEINTGDFSEKEMASGQGQAQRFYGKEKVSKKKIKISRSGKHKKKNLGLSEFGKYKDGKAVQRLKVSVEGKSKDKKAAKKNIITGKRTKKIASVKEQKNMKQQGRGNPVQFEFTGTDKKGKKVDVNRKRKAVFNPKTGEIAEKVKRKSGIGYRKTGRKVVDESYVSRARQNEKKRNTKIV